MKRDNCPLCGKTPFRFDGCSRIPCPQRKALSAQPVGESFTVRGRGAINGVVTSEGLYRKPTNIEE